MKAAALLCLATLAGCAAPRPALPPEVTASNVETCEAVFYLPPAAAQRAQIEADRRGINCRDYMQAAAELNSRRSAEAQARRAAVFQMLMPRPTVNCTTTSAFGTANTICR